MSFFSQEKLFKLQSIVVFEFLETFENSKIVKGEIE